MFLIPKTKMFLLTAFYQEHCSYQCSLCEEDDDEEDDDVDDDDDDDDDDEDAENDK